jgi:hypothetical protein
VLLLVDALATRLPKFESEMMFLTEKKMNNLNQIRTWSTAYPFLLLTDKLGKVQKGQLFDDKEAAFRVVYG